MFTKTSLIASVPVFEGEAIPAMDALSQSKEIALVLVGVKENSSFEQISKFNEMFESAGVSIFVIVNGFENIPSVQFLPLTLKVWVALEEKSIETSFIAVVMKVEPSNSHSYEVAFAIGATV